MQKVKSRFTLKTAREMKRYTQEEAAKRIGVSVDTLGNYERGKSYPDIPVLRKIEEVYGIPYEQLIFLPLDYDKTVNLGSRNFVVDATFLYLVASTLNGIQNAFKWNTVISDFW